MVFNQLDIHLLITAICVISSALICYTIGVWGERFQGHLKEDYNRFFVLGLYADAIAQLTHLHDTAHTVTGIIAICLMLIHAIWAIWTYFKGSLKAKQHFNRFSIVVWFIWLIPYCIGIYMGMSLHK